MDELNISTIFTAQLIKMIVRKIIKKKLGIDIYLNIHELHVKVPNDPDEYNIKLEIVADADIPKKDLFDLIRRSI